MNKAHMKGPTLFQALAMALHVGASPAANNITNDSTIRIKKRPAMYLPPTGPISGGQYFGRTQPTRGWRQAESRRRHQEIARRQRRNRRQARA